MTRLMQEKSEATGRKYPLNLLCEVLGVPRSSFYDYRRRCRAEHEERRRERKKSGPKIQVDDEALLERIREVLKRSPFHTEGTKKVHVRLRQWLGIRAGRERVNRVMRQAGLLSPQRIETDRRERKHEGTLIPDTINRIWGTDGTQFGLADGRLLWLFAVIDHYSAEVLGWHIIEVGKGTAWEALEPLRKAVRTLFGTVGQGAAPAIAIRHDWGPQYKANAFVKELAFLGLANSPAFVHEPETNGVIERFFRTLKEECVWLHDFRDAAEAREIIGRWIETYNEQWLIERNGFRSPRQVRQACEVAATKVA